MNNKTSKKLVTTLLKSEIEEHRLNAQILPVTSTENIQEIITSSIKTWLHNPNEKLDKILKDAMIEIRYSKQATGYSNQNKMKVLLKNLKKYSKSKEHYIWNLIHTTYHEYKHVLIYLEELKIKVV